MDHDSQTSSSAQCASGPPTASTYRSNRRGRSSSDRDMQSGRENTTCGKNNDSTMLPGESHLHRPQDIPPIAQEGDKQVFAQLDMHNVMEVMDAALGLRDPNVIVYFKQDLSHPS